MRSEQETGEAARVQRKPLDRRKRLKLAGHFQGTAAICRACEALMESCTALPDDELFRLAELLDLVADELAAMAQRLALGGEQEEEVKT